MRTPAACPKPHSTTCTQTFPVDALEPPLATEVFYRPCGWGVAGDKNTWLTYTTPCVRPLKAEHTQRGLHWKYQVVYQTLTIRSLVFTGGTVKAQPPQKISSQLRVHLNNHCISIYLSIYPSIYLSIYLCVRVYKYVCKCVYVCVYLFVCTYACMHAYMHARM